MKKYIILVISALIFHTALSAAEIRIDGKYFNSFFLLVGGAINEDSSSLQNDGVSEWQLGLSYLYGEKHKFIVGFGYSERNTDYFQIGTAGFKSKYSAIHLNLGYGYNFSDMLVEGGVIVRGGRFSFQENNNNLKKNFDGVVSVGAYLQGSHSFKFEKIFFQSLDVFVGIRIGFKDVDSFSYDGNGYQRSDFSSDGAIYIGGAIRF